MKTETDPSASASSDCAFDLNDDQRDVRDLVRRFVDEHIAPHAAQWDREHHFERSLYDKLGSLGLMGACVPEELGGAGLDFLSYIVMLEELSRGDAGVGVTVAVHTSAATLPIINWGTSEQQATFVPPMARGEIIGAFALTEPDSGSDAGSLRTTAVEQSDGSFLIRGGKQWISNGSHAGTFIVFARTEGDVAGPKGVTAFIVDGDASGLSVVREEEKLGLHSSSTADIALDDVVVAPDRMLGVRGAGFSVAMQALDGGRIGVAAQAVGIAQAAWDVASSYAVERRQFGKRIADFQGIQFKLADMATEIAAARALTWRAAALKDAGRDHTVEAAQAKLFASAVARRQTAEAIQVLGGYGYTTEFPAERYYRDAKVTEIYEGTSEVQRIVIARRLLGL